MLAEVSALGELRKAIDLRHSKLKPELLAGAGIWAELNKKTGRGFFGVLGTARKAVEINIPLLNKTMSLIAKKESGQLFLCHNGRLSPRLQISQPNVFREMAGDVHQVRLKNGRVEQHVVVASLNERPAQVVERLANYVRVCQKLVVAKVRALSDEGLKELARSAGKKHPKRSVVLTNQYERSEPVAAWAKRRAKGLCDLCGQTAPFNTSDGPYLECHHIVHLSEGGPDTSENTVALCPNCHRRMHYINDESDKQALMNRVGRYP
jgi:5-methylcytosine-specific restriction endonuclease McrA